MGGVASATSGDRSGCCRANSDQMIRKDFPGHLEVFSFRVNLTELTQTSGDALPYSISSLSPRRAANCSISALNCVFIRCWFAVSKLQSALLPEERFAYRDLPSICCVGYRQMWSYIEGEIPYDEMVYRGVCATRQLAKRRRPLRGWEGVRAD